SNSTTITVTPLTSIQVAPANPSILVGTQQQFTATGIYSNGSTVDLSSLANWSSQNPGLATIGGARLAIGASAGSAPIAASLNTLNGSPILTVATTFSSTGSLTAGRSQHTATLLNDGRVLIAGGSNGSALAGAELYVATSKAFSSGNNMHTA